MGNPQIQLYDDEVFRLFNEVSSRPERYNNYRRTPYYQAVVEQWFQEDYPNCDASLAPNGGMVIEFTKTDFVKWRLTHGDRFTDV